MNYRDILKITFNLIIIYLVGGLILALVYAKTSPVIYRNNLAEREAALKQMMPGADSIDKLGDWTSHGNHGEYFAAKKGGRTEGYIIQSYGKGYSSFIDTLIAVDPDFKILKISILGHAETPGLGDQIEAESFKTMFHGKDLEHLKVVKTDTKEYIQAISGATISTRAVAEDAVKSGVEFLIMNVKAKEAGDGGGK